MKPSRHPMDEVLARYGWERALLSALRSETDKLAARLVCIMPYSAPSGRLIVFAVDVNLWLEAGKVHMNTPALIVPTPVQPLITYGRQGVEPHVLSLAPCNHNPQLWNGFYLPLVWRPEMDDALAFNEMAKSYTQILPDLSWQCPEATSFM